MPVLTVEVTRDDIDRGCRYSLRFSPLALAIRRASGRNWMVDGDAVYRSWTDFIREIPLPREVRLWHLAYDAGKAVEPITFTLEVPDG